MSDGESRMLYLEFVDIMVPWKLGERRAISKTWT